MRARFLCTLQVASCNAFAPKSCLRWKPITLVAISRYTTSHTLRHPWTRHPLKSIHQDIEINSSINDNGSKSPKSLHRAFIALGSNLGDRIGMIERACNEMSSRGIKIKRTSSLWETEPMYVLDQANFINGVCEVSSNPSCEELYVVRIEPTTNNTNSCAVGVYVWYEYKGEAGHEISIWAPGGMLYLIKSRFGNRPPPPLHPFPLLMMLSTTCV